MTSTSQPLHSLRLYPRSLVKPGEPSPGGLAVHLLIVVLLPAFPLPSELLSWPSSALGSRFWAIVSRSWAFVSPF